MKKYIKPNVEIVKVVSQQMMASSDRAIANEDAGKTGDYYDDARQNNMWDIWGEGIDDDFDE